MDATLSLSRRSFLRFGGLSLGGMAMNPFGGASSFASGSAGGSLTTDKTVIFLFMQGGPTQFETFDPKPDAPDGVRTVGDVIPTSIPGVHFGEAFPKLAALANKLALVRSFVTGTQHGGLKPIVSEMTQGASLGAVYSRIVGAVNAKTGLPNAACLFPVSVNQKEALPRDRFGRFDATGPVGTAYAPFLPGGGGTFQENMKLRLDPTRLQDRRTLLGQIDSLQRNIDSTTFDGIDGQRQQSAEMLLKGAAAAFDLTRESQRTIDRYDTAKFVNPALWGTRKNGPNYTVNCNTLGKLLLLSRRLAEAGCGFITINTDFVWDFHADGNNVGVADGSKLVGAPFDHAVSAFIDDLEARGLSEKVLLVCCGEMGRTPKLNKNGGRDHWPKLAPLFLYGGGMTHGQVVGKSTKDGGEPATTQLEPKHLLATIAHTLLDVGKARIAPGMTAEVIQMLNAIDKVPGVI